MNPDDKELLQKTYDLAQENSHILRGIRRSNRWSAVIKTLYWIVIIGVSVGAFYYIQPYINSVMKAYQNIQSAANSLPKF